MEIRNDCGVLMHYTLKNDAGEVIDSSEDEGPLGYIHGHDQIVPGLEKHLNGKTAGDKIDVVIDSEEGYGPYRDELLREVSREAFEGADELKVGMQFSAEGPSGRMVVRVAKIEGDQITIDANHPLAGENLHFSIEVTEVRECTAEELAHGHLHGEDGHE